MLQLSSHQQTSEQPALSPGRALRTTFRSALSPPPGPRQPEAPREISLDRCLELSPTAAVGFIGHYEFPTVLTSHLFPFGRALLPEPYPRPIGRLSTSRRTSTASGIYSSKESTAHEADRELWIFLH
ncbi:hypothetical protein P153DRAFT_175277 [Dothidotthia symphoricarpi CBS 119687]|uniref:Uncharacterized protein n=1 Tax=Dothidotthia symphoricarpi CBS 119687 TaxID=1392245 RepID=A0A6A6AM27_9PLEO|nr:uncharacterized protein P153DRAFT_175277 [Dothidotthia symphoricarpi CBS 119687]KAF2132850.1 hypothetical protein P153DRAFT_175277 [Dothidotthia symphoricarpi CBS 119687]